MTEQRRNPPEGRQAPDEHVRRLIRGARKVRVPVRLDPDLELQSNMIVAAGAGSGKTTALIERMIAQVRAGCTPDKLVAITFTRKAAGELQERFFSGLIEARKIIAERVSDSPEDERALWTDELACIEDALQRSEEAYIGTIHSFCARILRQFPVAAGLPPDFQQIEKADELDERSVYWRVALAGLDESNDAGLGLIRELEVPDEALYQLFSVCVENPGVEFDPSGAERPDLSEVTARMERFVKAVVGQFPHNGKPDTFRLAVERAHRLLDMHDLDTDARRAHFLDLIMAAVKRGDQPSLEIGVQSWGAKSTPEGTLAYALKGGEDDLVDGMSLLHFVTHKLVPTVEAWQHWMHDQILSLVSPIADAYRKDRIGSGRLTYDDLLREASALVGRNERVRLVLQDQIQHLMVDEFQDTDPVQAALLFNLCGREVDASDWRKNPLLPGRLFVVGDDKQSIYRFRKADFQAFSLVCEAIKAQGGLHLVLTTNFRSDARLCAFVNGALSDRFAEEGSRYQAPWEDLRPYNDALHAHPAVVRVAVEKQASGRSDKPRTIAEARKLAELIRDTTQRDGLSFGDWMILVRSHARVPLFLQVLSEAGLPVAVEGGKGDKASDVVDMVHDLMSSLVNPSDSVSLVATLTGIWFGVSDADLYAYRRTEGRWDDWMADAFQRDEVPIRVQEAASTLQRWSRKAREEKPLILFERILAESGVAGTLRHRSDGEVAVGMLELVGQLFGDWQQRGYSLARCVRELGRYRTGDLGLELYSDNVPFGDSVRIMTIHGSKGLQARRVILADVSPPGTHKIERHIWREGVHLRSKAPVRSQRGTYATSLYEPAGWGDAEAEEKRFEQGERTRLLYVAATRAIEQLFVCTHLDEEKARGTWDSLIPALKDADVPVLEVIPTEEDRIPGFVRRDAAPSGWPAPHERFDPAERIEALKRSTWRVRLPSDSEQEHAMARVTVDDSVRSGRDARARGSAWHTVFEAVVARRKQENIREVVPTMLKEVFSGVHADIRHDLEMEAPGRMDAFLGSSLWARLVGADRVLTEVPFTIADKGGEETVLVSGIVDLAFHDENGWTIVDYKSDRTEEEAIRAGHASQIEAYVQAWKTLFPGQDVRGVIWSIQLDRELTIIDNATS